MTAPPLSKATCGGGVHCQANSAGYCPKCHDSVICCRWQNPAPNAEAPLGPSSPTVIVQIGGATGVAGGAELPELPEPALFAPQMITEDAYTADQMRAYVESDRARRQGALTDEEIDAIFDAHQEAPTMTYRYHVARAIIAALSLKGAGG